MNTTQLSANPEKLINNLRFSFTQSTTVLGELMQNARRAGGTFELLASSPLGEKTVSTPAFAHGKLFMRGSTHLYCIGKN